MGTNVNYWLAELGRILPKIIGAALVLVVGWIVARAIGSLVRRGLHRLGLDRSVRNSPAAGIVGRATSSPSRVTGQIAFWLVFLGVIALAVSLLGIPALTAVVAAVYAYLPNVVGALLILFVAGAVAAALGRFVARVMGDTPTGRMLSTIVPGAIFSIAIFMALNQLMIAPQIVAITYAAILGSLALGTALAFGLGGRDVASRLLEQAYIKGQQQTFQFRQDMAANRARQEAEQETWARAQAAKEREATQPSRPAGSPAPSFGETIGATGPDRETPRRSRRTIE
jgi:hypothetical protein